MSGVWNLTTPLGSEAISNGDDSIRELKTAIQYALQAQATEGVEAIFPGSAPSTAPVFRYRGLKDITGNRPTAGQYGLFFDTTRQSLQRDNGSSWDDIGTNIPVGTVMVFYQASVPTGWSAVAANDRFLRVVTGGGTGGTTGGTHAASTSLAHSHTVNAHTHTTPTHVHHLDNSFSSANGGTVPLVVNGSGQLIVSAGGASTGTVLYSTVSSEGGGTSGSTSPGTDTQFAGSFQYADVVLGTKS